MYLYEPILCQFSLQMTLDEDLRFLRALAQEGDLQSAITMSCVLWKYLRNDETAVSEIQTWIRGFIDILTREEYYEEIVTIRGVCEQLMIPLIQFYSPEVTYQTATACDQKEFASSLHFFAEGPRFSERFETPPPLDLSEVPFVPTGLPGSPISRHSSNRQRSERWRKHRDSKQMNHTKRENEITRSRRGERQAEVNSFCSVCHMKNQGLVAMCLRCGHGGHLVHIQEWFGVENRTCAVPTCDCCCVFRG